jgi:hypothetical protein
MRLEPLTFLTHGVGLKTLIWRGVSRGESNFCVRKGGTVVVNEVTRRFVNRAKRRAKDVFERIAKLAPIRCYRTNL